MVFHEENRYRCRRSCSVPPSARTNRIQPVEEHTCDAARPPRPVR